MQKYHMQTRTFIKKLSRNIFFGCLIIIMSLSIGILGYHHFEQMPWVDAFVNACMILSGMGPVGTLVTSQGKIFAGLYALFSGVIFLVVIAIIFAPVVHRFFRLFHMDADQK
jgi:hypothetical protein